MRRTTTKSKKEPENMGAELFAAVDMLEATKGIPKTYMLEKIEAALISAYKKEENAANVRICLDPEKKQVRMFQQKTVVETVENPKEEISVEEAAAISRRYQLGDIVEFEMKTKSFGRLSAQAAKQVIIQGIREAEHSNIVREYEKKHEEVITATVTKVNDNSGDIVIDTGTSEAVLLKAEQLSTDNFAVGDHLKVFVTEVNRESHGPVVTLSRTHPGMVKRMLELLVPEIQEGVILVKGIAREAGSRTKIAVFSRDPDVDAVGACIGLHRARISPIINELGGEKIDIIPYSDVPEEFISNALAPARVISVVIDENNPQACRVCVPDHELSLAIGHKGQNARLAARLTGFKIDIRSQSTFDQEEDEIDETTADAEDIPAADLDTAETE